MVRIWQVYNLLRLIDLQEVNLQKKEGIMYKIRLQKGREGQDKEQMEMLLYI